MHSEKLIYIDDTLPGIRRKGAGKGWAYYDAKGVLIRDRAEKARLNAVALPPAYSDAWFCPAPNGHILATGYDDKGRKQYRYHPEFRAMKEREKFDGCAVFGELLPLLRKRVDEDIQMSGIRCTRVIASVVRLLDRGFVRVGNDVYARENKSYGATTLKQRHASVDGAEIHLHYRGKSGQDRAIELRDDALSEVVSELQDLPGQDLFQYIGDDGARHPIGSSDVNTYIRETMGEDFTAKMFRTWHASVLGFTMAYDANGELTIAAMLEEVSARLGNTPAVTRSSYIHPDIIAALGGDKPSFSTAALPRKTRYQSRYERGLIEFLTGAA
ncbi:DNA topoisomerase IB [Pontixanthobacter sp.]|uniref:DNA topoisomerase IB n=1 Tax=Pontixanthobacter sp. TaxID=2792078 RepID=UPI003C7B3BE3